VARTARTKAGTKAGAAKPVTEAVAADTAQIDPSISESAVEHTDLTSDATAESPVQSPDMPEAEALAEPEAAVAPETAVEQDATPEPETAIAPETAVAQDATPEPETAIAPESDAPPVADVPNLTEPVAPEVQSASFEREAEPDPMPETEAGPVTEPVREQIAPPVPPVPPALPRPATAIPPAQRSSVVPLVLGGVVAAGLGFGAAWYWTQSGTEVDAATVAAQAERIAALESALESVLADLPQMPDLAPLEAQIAAIGTDVTQEVAALDASVAAALEGFDERLAALERAPSEDGTLAQTAIEVWERELDALRADVAAERDRMQQIADEADARLAQTRVEATALVDDASETASAAVARAALSRVAAAIDAGTPFDAPLAELAAEGVTVPVTLTETAREGVASLATLTATFPAAARAALATARIEGLAGEEGGGFSAFLRSQFDVRSVTPRDGTDPDAVLSRAEAALQANRLSDALAEVASLPEVARAEMSGWIAAADARLAALAAVLDLSQSLNQN